MGFNSYVQRTTILLCLVIPPASTQIRLYDAKRDAAAQEARKTADKIQTGDVFQRQTRNLQLLTEKDVAATLEDARIEMSTAINAFVSWSDVEEMIHAIKPSCRVANPPAGIADATQMLHQREAALKAEIKAIQASAASSSDPGLDLLANDLGQIDSALKFAQIDNAAVSTTIKVLDQLDSLYKAYQDQMAAIDSAKAKLQDLKIELKKALLASLKVDEDYLLTKVALYQRCLEEYKPIQQLKDGYKLPPGVQGDERIDVTLQRLSGSPPDLQVAAKSLFLGAALASRGALPGRLYDLRAAELEHLHSIRSSAANARVYETILGGGVERLALFYQGGIKPETLGQIVQSLSTAGIFGKILSQ